MQDPGDKKNFYRLLRQILTAWTADSIPDVAETWVQFKARVKEAQDEIKSMADEGNKILAIGSGGSISTFVGMVLKYPMRMCLILIYNTRTPRSVISFLIKRK